MTLAAGICIGACSRSNGTASFSYVDDSCDADHKAPCLTLSAGDLLHGYYTPGEVTESATEIHITVEAESFELSGLGSADLITIKLTEPRNGRIVVVNGKQIYP